MQYHVEYYPVEHVSINRDRNGIKTENTYKGWFIGEAYIPVPLDVVDELGHDDGEVLYMVDVERKSPEIAFLAAYRMIQVYIESKE